MAAVTRRGRAERGASRAGNGGWIDPLQPLPRAYGHPVAGVAMSLIQRHAREWTTSAHGSASYQHRSGAGLHVILRTPSCGPRRLVSALILTDVPATPAAWRRLRAYCLKNGLASLASAKHRYLIVQPQVLRQARLAMRGSRVKVLPNKQMHLPGVAFRATAKSKAPRRHARR